MFRHKISKSYFRREVSKDMFERLFSKRTFQKENGNFERFFSNRIFRKVLKVHLHLSKSVSKVACRNVRFEKIFQNVHFEINFSAISVETYYSQKCSYTHELSFHKIGRSS